MHRSINDITFHFSCGIKGSASSRANPNNWQFSLLYFICHHPAHHQLLSRKPIPHKHIKFQRVTRLTDQKLTSSCLTEEKTPSNAYWHTNLQKNPFGKFRILHLHDCERTTAHIHTRAHMSPFNFYKAVNTNTNDSEVFRILSRKAELLCAHLLSAKILGMNSPKKLISEPHLYKWSSMWKKRQWKQFLNSIYKKIRRHCQSPIAITIILSRSYGIAKSNESIFLARLCIWFISFQEPTWWVRTMVRWMILCVWDDQVNVIFSVVSALRQTSMCALVWRWHRENLRRRLRQCRFLWSRK